MNNDNSVNQAAWGPLKFHFQVQWDGKDMSFQEVSGLDMTTEPIENRQGASSPQFPKMPGLVRCGTITLKKGTFTADKRFYDFLNQSRTGTVECMPVTITLIDESENENNSAVMRWTLSEARPGKITGSELTPDGKNIRVESLEIMHTGITVDKG
ncbi:MAG: phage tail protein [Treponema sp.]|nr:phage tail protein [Treponema sp.]